MLSPLGLSARTRGQLYALVNVDALELEVVGTVVSTRVVDAVLVGENLPELGT